MSVEEKYMTENFQMSFEKIQKYYHHICVCKCSNVCANLTQSLMMELEQRIIKLLQQGLFPWQSHNLHNILCYSSLHCKKSGLKILDISRYILKWIMTCKYLDFFFQFSWEVFFIPMMTEYVQDVSGLIVCTVFNIPHICHRSHRNIFGEKL